MKPRTRNTQTPSDEKLSPGLYIVATPIGNLGDLSRRAAEILCNCDLIACEDTRVTGKLLNHLDSAVKMMRYNDHSKDTDRSYLIEKMQDSAIALVSDAGTPLISDPGYKLVRNARDAGIFVTTIPGPSAVVSALTLSGLPTDSFYFAGFLPSKSRARNRALENVKNVDTTLVFYESGPRLAACLQHMCDVLGDRDAAISREITKKFEETVTGPLSDLAEKYKTSPPKGEIVITVAPPDEDTEEADTALVEAALREAMEEMSTSKAAGMVAKTFGVDRKELYAKALVLKS